MKKVLLIVHQATSDPGLVGQMLRHRGYALDIRCPAVHQELPATVDEHEATVIFGGPMSANDDGTLPFIQTELDWIPIALASGKPFLGICLGAQLLARVLGATVAPHPHGLMEVGYAPIAPTPEGQDNFKGLSHVYHWHREGFELPEGAVLLAKGDVFVNQAFRYGEAAYGVQFHPEITPEMIELWTTKAAHFLSLPGAQPRDQQLQNYPLYAPALQNWLSQFLDQWIKTSEAIAL